MKIMKIIRRAVCAKSVNTKPRMIKVSISIYLKRSTSVRKSVNTKPCKIKNIYQKRSASVHKSVDTKPHMK